MQNTAKQPGLVASYDALSGNRAGGLRLFLQPCGAHTGPGMTGPHSQAASSHPGSSRVQGGSATLAVRRRVR